MFIGIKKKLKRNYENIRCKHNSEKRWSEN